MFKSSKSVAFASALLLLLALGCHEKESTIDGATTATAADTTASSRALSDTSSLEEEIGTAIDESVPTLPTDEFGNELSDPDQGSLEDERSGALEAAANIIKERVMKAPSYDPDQQ